MDHDASLVIQYLLSVPGALGLVMLYAQLHVLFN
jgi:hypothetical protein